MNCSLLRQQYREDGVFGTLLDENGNVLAWTLEHAFQTVGTFQPKFPSGIYLCKRRLSPRFGFDVFELIDVPGCSFIEIHIGNFNSDSDGCILLGAELAQSGEIQMITKSRETFDKFMTLQEGVDSFTLTVTD